MARVVTVAVPATSANMGPGFDSLGIALDITGQVTLRLDDERTAPPAGNAVPIMLLAARSAFSRAGVPVPEGLSACYEGDMPVGRGLGASAVLRVGAIVAANQILDQQLSSEELLQLASELEGHADNVAPALFGGFQVVVWNGAAVTRVEVPFPAALRAVLLVPDLEMPTAESRKLLPEQLSRAGAVHNIGRAALLVAALATGRLDALRVASDDVLHQPARAALFPALFPIIAAANRAGARCAYLSGAGSAVLALADAGFEGIGAAMLAAAEEAGMPAHVLHSGIRRCGAEVLRNEQS
jgi:homoserine kinase